MTLIKFIGEHYVELAQLVTLIVASGEIITRLTPTKTDDGFVKRIGEGLDRILDLLKIPNLRKNINDNNSAPD